MARQKTVKQRARGPMREAHKQAIARAMEEKWRERRGLKRQTVQIALPQPPEDVISQEVSFTGPDAPAETSKRRTLSVILMEMAEEFKTLDALRNELADYLE